MDTIAICAIFKNEAPFLLEWIAFHRTIGVDHFFLYDNGSEDGGADRVRQSSLGRYATLIDWPDRPGQISAYRDFIEHHAKQFTWVGFIDLDEFIHLLNDNSLRDVLSRPQYNRFSAVLLNWTMFGPSEHDRRPDGLVIDAYVRRLPDDDAGNRHVKSIVRSAHLQGVGPTPHVFPTTGPSCNASGDEAPSHAIQASVCHATMILNHYFTRSREDWETKLQRGRADTPDESAAQYHMSMFDGFAAQATVEDRRIGRFAPRLRWVMR